ncbi:MAG: hypothetical protein WBP64_13205 [Nitrososphaeraceae archaeon]
MNQNEELKLVDKEGKRLTIKQFITEYEKDGSLIPYFRRAKIDTFYNKATRYQSAYSVYL